MKTEINMNIRQFLVLLALAITVVFANNAEIIEAQELENLDACRLSLVERIAELSVPDFVLESEALQSILLGSDSDQTFNSVTLDFIEDLVAHHEENEMDALEISLNTVNEEYIYRLYRNSNANEFSSSTEFIEVINEIFDTEEVIELSFVQLKSGIASEAENYSGSLELGEFPGGNTISLRFSHDFGLSNDRFLLESSQALLENGKDWNNIQLLGSETENTSDIDSAVEFEIECGD